MVRRRHFSGSKGTRSSESKMSNGSTIDVQFLELIKAQRYDEAIALIPQVQDINALDPSSGATALHMAAGRRATRLLKALWTRSDLNELCQDTNGRYPSEVAWHIGGDEALAASLMEREHAYAQKNNTQAWPKPTPG